MKLRTALAAAAGLMIAAFTAQPAEAGEYCREYTRTVYIGNKAQESYGTACLQPDGAWQVVNESEPARVPNSRIAYQIDDGYRVIREPEIRYVQMPPQRVVYYRPAPPRYGWNNNHHWNQSHNHGRDNDRDRNRYGRDDRSSFGFYYRN